MSGKKYKIYLDVCCLNRPFDDWSGERVRLEGEAVSSIIERVRSGEWELIAGEAVEVELERLRDLEKLESIFQLLESATTRITIEGTIDARSRQLESLGFGLYDSFHLASAETAGVDVFLTTDDRLLKKAERYRERLRVSVKNPVNWLMYSFQLEGDDNDDPD